MKHSILGFSQAKLSELGVGLDEALILRYFIDFKDTGKMIKVEDSGQTYYWIKYEAIKESLPILKLSKDSIYRKLKNLVKAGILEHKTVSNFGTYSFYGIGKNYIELIDDEKNNENTSQNENNHTSENSPNPTQKSEDSSENNPTPLGENSDTPSENNPNPLGKFSGAKDISFNNKSFKDNSSFKDKEIYTRVVDYLNQKAKTNYRATSKNTQQLIHARLADGFTEGDLMTVIDKKVKEWANTDMAKYLRPETLFCSKKFEGYLNQKNCTATKTTPKQGNFCNYEQRDYDFENLEKKLLGWDQDV